jgi:site-specific DNA-methyltransferase (adenine-specific)
MLLRGEVIWVKAEGATNSFAWGSYRSPVNPVLRDVSERIILASKGRFDRARKETRKAEGLPSEATIGKEQFMECTLDIWRVAPESARRVGHPAPFPVEIPGRLIQLYTFKGDVVLDPFLGSGTTGVAAAQADRHFVGYELKQSYAEKAHARIENEISFRDLVVG